MNPLYVAFYTRGTLYEAEAERLMCSLDRLGLPHEVVDIDSLGSVVENQRHTATFIKQMMARHPGRPLVYLDADAVVWRRPTLFDDMGDYDLAVHYVADQKLANGTLYLAPTPAARKAVERYAELIFTTPNCTNEQTMLEQAIDDMGDSLKVCRLPAGMCFIHDINARFLGPDEEVTIEHLQASREGNHCEAWGRRRKRLAEVGIALGL